MSKKDKKLNLNDFYQGLPEEILKNSTRLKLDTNKCKNIINELVPEDKSSNQQKIDGNKFKALSLDDRISKSKISKSARKLSFNKRKQKESKLTCKQRQNLFKIDKTSKNLKYELFLELNKLWRKYIGNLMKINYQSINRNQILNYLNCLVKADYHGALFIVSNSKNPLLIGLKGIVIKENKKVFYLINENNRILIIPKSGTVFAFEINDKIFKLNGNFIQINSHQRTRAKFKQTKLNDDF